jgi:hypothetical protein
VGQREYSDAFAFIQNLASRLAERVQLSTDAFKTYRNAVEQIFGCEVDYGTETKIFHAIRGTNPTETHYSPPTFAEVARKVVLGSPDPDLINISHNERNNLTMRMQMRRFTRLTNGFSKKYENHEYAVALHFMNYNFCQIHGSLRCTPAMAAGVTDHVWSLEEVIGLLDSEQAKAECASALTSPDRSP